MVFFIVWFKVAEMVILKFGKLVGKSYIIILKFVGIKKRWNSLWLWTCKMSFCVNLGKINSIKRTITFSKNILNFLGKMAFLKNIFGGLRLLQIWRNYFKIFVVPYLPQKFSLPLLSPQDCLPSSWLALTLYSDVWRIIVTIQKINFCNFLYSSQPKHFHKRTKLMIDFDFSILTRAPRSSGSCPNSRTSRPDSISSSATTPWPTKKGWRKGKTNIYFGQKASILNISGPDFSMRFLINMPTPPYIWKMEESP